MKKRKLSQSLRFKKITISTLSEKEIKGGTFGTYFVDLCYGAQTSYFGVCAAQCPPPGR
ncbi:hypothetical protein H2O64_21950 [Kordia sp. YSTF-M3]|uniref:Bacteriocin n=1 Tax=Kordia aestuariivivens TaxID=2759037 RepID=A0ABR7QFS0_9FLAO|nr:hypothetical protein [Kordia aestuariivivens]MBC8757348.1 hypothetical protein [Kordia aestuariivivens]